MRSLSLPVLLLIASPLCRTTPKNSKFSLFWRVITASMQKLLLWAIVWQAEIAFKTNCLRLRLHRANEVVPAFQLCIFLALCFCSWAFVELWAARTHKRLPRCEIRAGDYLPTIPFHLSALKERQRAFCNRRWFAYRLNDGELNLIPLFSVSFALT